MAEPTSTGSGEDSRFDDDRSLGLFARLPDDKGARDELVLRYRPLAEYLARRFHGRGEAIEDLSQVAYVGLIKAIDRFDPSREVKFSTFASVTIVGELKRHFRDTTWALRVPRGLQELGLQVSRVMAELSQSLGRSPTVGEIAKRAGLSDEAVLEAMEISNAYSTVSLDAPADDGTSSVNEPGVDDETYELLEGWASVAGAVKELPPRERRILYLRFFRGMTQTQIAEEIGISQMHVSRLLARSLARLRDSVADDDAAFE
jgi:RNA polymerase sigma-B factor